MEMRSGHCGHMHTGQWSLSGRSGTTGPQSAGNRAHVAQCAVQTFPVVEHLPRVFIRMIIQFFFPTCQYVY